MRRRQDLFEGKELFEHVLGTIRELVRSLQYIVTLHADEEMDEDDLSIFDVESALLTGEIKERQRDILTEEWKYRVVGVTIEGGKVNVVVKVGATGKLVIITVYAD